MHVPWIGVWKEKLRKECSVLDPGLCIISSLHAPLSHATVINPGHLRNCRCHCLFVHFIIFFKHNGARKGSWRGTGMNLQWHRKSSINEGIKKIWFFMKQTRFSACIHDS
uniref:Uncharacterized protein n=1 Tax=Micrurus spixii TaxID=129469 RepID=A0A2D4LW02_9SAUR